MTGGTPVYFDFSCQYYSSNAQYSFTYTYHRSYVILVADGVVMQHHTKKKYILWSLCILWRKRRVYDVLKTVSGSFLLREGKALGPRSVCVLCGSRPYRLFKELK